MEQESETPRLTAVEDAEEQGDEAKDSKESKRKKPEKISFENTMQAEEAVAYFEAIVAGLRKGALQFRRGEDLLELSPGGQVEVKVKASSKGRKEKVEFEMRWVQGESDLEIS